MHNQFSLTLLILDFDKTSIKKHITKPISLGI